jgi:hypothetical protein
MADFLQIDRLASIIAGRLASPTAARVSSIAASRFASPAGISRMANAVAGRFASPATICLDWPKATTTFGALKIPGRSRRPSELVDLIDQPGGHAAVFGPLDTLPRRNER